MKMTEKFLKNEKEKLWVKFLFCNLPHIIWNVVFFAIGTKKYF